MTDPVDELFMNDALQHVQQVGQQVEDAASSFLHLLAAKMVREHDLNEEKGIEASTDELDVAALNGARQVVSLLQAVAQDPVYNKFMAEFSRIQAEAANGAS